MAQLTVGLVSCCKPKLEQPAPARDLYLSPLFRMSVEVCEQRFDEWAILSAKHGLVDPDQVVSPYDESLTSMPAARRRDWARRVEHEICTTWLGPTVFHVFAGRHYVAALANLPHVDELHGLSIGHRLRRLSEMLREGA